MSELVLLGDEALAIAAIHSGISLAYGYPGTPSTEIMDFIQEYAKKEGRPKAAWCCNEKTAYEEALGVSFVGRRALVIMKHVGLNVAADPFINSALLAINGGLVLAVADDPGMHSSQNEQDSRFYADFARIICLEPANQQEVYEMTRKAFELSERFQIPVMVRLVTRLAHSRAQVRVGEAEPEKPLHKVEDAKTWMLLPALARIRWEKLLGRQKELLDFSEASLHNRLELNEDFTEYGVITTGLAENYYEENPPEMQVKPSHLHIGAYPLPVAKIRKLADRVRKIVILEEGYAFLERKLRGVLPPALPIAGKESGDVPEAGELNPDNVRAVLGLGKRKVFKLESEKLPARPPQLCLGCPHTDTFAAMKKALESFEKSVVTSDIGCYALGVLPPYSMGETLVCMGASIGIAKGASEAGYRPAVAVIGDSTFLHSGISPLVDASAADTDMTVVIMDNEAVGMTGGQATVLPSFQLEKVVKGTGVDLDHVKIIEARRSKIEENAGLIRKELEYSGLSVIISVRECIETAKIKKAGVEK